VVFFSIGFHRESSTSIISLEATGHFLAVGMLRWDFTEIDIGHDGRDEIPDFLDIFLLAGRNQVPRDGLRGEQASPRDADFNLGSGPIVTVEGLHGQADDEPVRRNIPLPGGFFDPVPLFGSEPDVLLDGLRHRVGGQSSAFRSVVRPRILSVLGSGFRFCKPNLSRTCAERWGEQVIIQGAMATAAWQT